MPAKSKAQQVAMGMAYAARTGRLAVSKLKGNSLRIYKGKMSTADMRDFAKTKRKGLPAKARKVKSPKGRGTVKKAAIKKAVKKIKRSR